MFGFFLKKNFCDGWDNILYLIIPNIFVLLLGVGCFGLTTLIYTENALVVILSIFLTMIVILCLFSILALAFSKTAVTISNFQTPKLAGFIKEIPSSLKDGFLFGLLNAVLLFVGFLAISAYLSMINILGFSLAAVLIAFETVFFLSLQWFIPLKALLGGGFIKNLKKCFVIFFDNPGFSLLMAFYNIILFVSSALMLLLIPSVSGVVLSSVNALRLRLYKYDWLDAHPEYKKDLKKRKNIPWNQLLQEDEETLGPRNFKSFFMPWKSTED